MGVCGGLTRWVPMQLLQDQHLGFNRRIYACWFTGACEGVCWA